MERIDLCHAHAAEATKLDLKLLAHALPMASSSSCHEATTPYHLRGMQLPTSNASACRGNLGMISIQAVAHDEYTFTVATVLHPINVVKAWLPISSFLILRLSGGLHRPQHRVAHHGCS